MEFHLENPLANSFKLRFDTGPSLFLIESDHMPSQNYLRTLKMVDFAVSCREEAISSILQISCNFDSLLSYLAVNYLDRFLSSHGIPKRNPWVFRLLAACCVSLAAKMSKTEFCLADIQGDGGFVFDKKTIQRMEALILGALNWRMRSITPFSFIYFFISLLKLKDPPLKEALKARAFEIIFKAQNDVKLLDFKPSIIAASALLSASRELFPLQLSCFRKAICNCSYVSKENVLECYSSMQDTAREGDESLFDTMSGQDSPVNVLDRLCSCSEREKRRGTGHSASTDPATCTNTNKVWTEKDTKRRKISGYCDNQTVQLSQIQQC